jgi:hypothetical protein
MRSQLAQISALRYARLGDLVLSNGVILSLQVGGLTLAIALLVVLWHQAPIVATAFTLALGVHVVGDILRLKKDGLI